MSQIKVKIAGRDMSTQFSGLKIEQSVGSHHEFELIIHSEERGSLFKGSLAENAKKWIGELLEVKDIFKGVVTAVSLLRTRTGGSDFIIKGQSPTIYLDDGIHAHSFGEKNLKQIIDEVLKPYESNFDEVALDPKYKENIKYCVQYRESHFSFINRLAARYGEWFFYDGFTFNFGKLAESEAIKLNYEYDLQNFSISIKTLPVNFKLRAYDYKEHQFPVKTASYNGLGNEYAKIAFDKSKQDIFPETTSVPIHFSMNEKDLGQITTLRQNLHLSELVVLTGTSSRPDLKVGNTINVIDPRLGFDFTGTDNYGEYIITGLTHHISGEREEYTNHFEAIPKDAVVPPLITSPDPPLCEMQEAEVVENNDPKSLGRVRVQFMWQKELAGADSKTPWIRVAAHSSGSDKGLYIIPEKGDTVLVAFDHNHPERPFVLSSLYHGESKPEHHDPENLKKALKTKGGHELLMNDEKGKESMALTSPFDFSATAVGGKMNMTAGTEMNMTAGADTNMTAKSKITIKSESGDISINTPTNISIDADGNITIEAKGDITLEANNINLKGKASINLEAPNIDIKATAQLKGSGTQVNIEGTAATNVKGGAMLNLEATGVTSVSGTMLKLN